MRIDVERLKHDREYWDSVAPEGATHFGPKSATHCAAWFKGLDDCTQHCMALIPGFNNDMWHNCLTARDDRFPRPSPAWDGSGLPPVGVECEVMAKGGQWKSAIVLAHIETVHGKDKPCVAYQLTHNKARVGWVMPRCCRPLKTEKERVVEAVMDVACFGENMRRGLELAYDAGALKMPEGGNA